MPLRLIIHPPTPGADNMAIDEAILTTVNDGKAPATLRFYQWSQPTISLGYFQKFEEFTSQDPTIANLPVVRRQTGGGAILHDDELTYSLIIPLDGSAPVTDIEPLYQLVHDAVIATLADYGVNITYRGGDDRGNAQRGPFFCFARTHRLDLVAGQLKILGSAQRRVKNAVLQHGSLILKRHFTQQESAELLTLVPENFTLPDFINQTASRIAKAQHLNITLLSLPPSECDLAHDIQSRRYNKDNWNQLR